MDRLAQTASVRPSRSSFARLAYANRLADYFTQDASIHMESLGPDLPVISSRSDLVEAAMAARSQLNSAEFQLADFDVKFPEGKGRASAYVLICGRINRETNRFAQGFKMNLVKTNGHWLITRVNTVAGLQ
jgi:hypothetical protein